MTQFDHLITPDDPIESLESAVALIQAKVEQTPYIKGGDSSFESFFSTLTNRFVLGSGGVYNSKLTPFPANDPLLHKLIGLSYAKVRHFIVDIESGFKGNVFDYLSLIKTDIIPGLLALERDLKLLKITVGAVLNGTELLQDQQGIPTLTGKTLGIDPKALMAVNNAHVKSFRKEVQFGDVYANISQWRDCYTVLTDINDALAQLNVVAIAQMANNFSEQIADLKKHITHQNVNNAFSSKAIGILSQQTERVAAAVTLSVIIQSSMKDWTTALNNTRMRLEKQV